METTRAPVVTPAPAVEGPAPAAVGAAPTTDTSNASLLTALGLATTASMPPITELASLLPSLGSVGTVVLDALAPDAAVALATAHSSLDWVSEWLATGDPVTGREPALAVQSDAAAGQPTTFEEAMSMHARGVAMVNRVFESARSIVPDPEAGPDSRPTLLHNSVEWLDEGEANLVILSPTHDGAQRGVAAGNQAYFDTRAAWGADATYDPTLDSAGKAKNNGGITTAPAGVLGSMDGTELRLFQPAARSETDLIATVIHEVQHDADQHGPGAAMDGGTAPETAPIGTASDKYHEKYRSEFRAYWLQDPPGSEKDWFAAPDVPIQSQFGVSASVNGAVQTVATDFAIERQADIFRQLMGTPPSNLVWFDPISQIALVPYGWAAYYYVTDPAFKLMVDTFVEVESGNPVNSVRIQALSDAIEQGDEGAIDQAVAALDGVDRAALYDLWVTDPFWRRAVEMLGEEAAESVRLAATETRDEAPADDEGTVAVQRGETLVDLAERFLGDPERAAELAELNHLPLSSINAPLTTNARILLPES